MKEQLQKIVDGSEAATKIFAVKIVEEGRKFLPEIFSATQTLREKSFQNRVSLCQIINIKSGNCSENCQFCAQAKHVAKQENVFSLSKKRILQQLQKNGFPKAEYVGLVASGRSVSLAEIEEVCDVFHEASSMRKYCASFGILESHALLKLKKAGVIRYHHNLETSEAFFPKICQTHTWQERFNTVIGAKKAGLSVCSGGILGVGESIEDRVELAFSLKKANVDSIPINFLTPIPATPFAEMPPLEPLEMLLSIAMFRLVHPSAEIRVAAGRKLLGALESFLFMAGANGVMIGDLLTVKGSDIEKDMRLLQSLHLLPSS